MRSIARHRSRVALAIAAVLIIGALLAACGGGQPAPAPTQVAQAPAPTQVVATQPPPTQVPPTNTAVPPTVTTAPTATTAPTLAPSATTAPTATKAVTTTAPVAAAATSADAASCVKCHTDEATLQKLAKAETPKEKLSEGEG
jgi:hypothetical protein